MPLVKPEVSGPYSEKHESSPHNKRYILILFSSLYLGLLIVLFLSRFMTKISYAYVIFPSHPSSLDSVIYIIFAEEHILCILILQFSPPSCYFSLSSYTHNPYSSLTVTVSHPFETTGEITVLYKTGSSHRYYRYWHCAVWNGYQHF
jgi:hypothetical protein